MKFVAIDKERVSADSDGKGWRMESRVKEFDETSTVKEIWDWYHRSNTIFGILEIVALE